MTPLVLILALSVGAEPQPKPRVDLYGDPLPDGAVARMGSLQLRHEYRDGWAIHTDGKTLLVTGDDRSVRFWNLETGALVRTARVGDGAKHVQEIAVSPDGKTVAIVDAGRATLWDVATNQPGPSFAIPNATRPDLVFFDGNRLAVLREDSRVVLWDRDSGKERTVVFSPRRFGADSSYHARLSPDRKWLVGLGGWETPFCIFDAASRREVHRIACSATISAFSPDGKLVAISDMANDKKQRETVIRYFDLETGNAVKQFPLGHSDPFHSLVFSPDDKMLVCGYSNRGVVLDAATGAVVHRLPTPPVRSLFTPDGKTLVTDHGHRMRVWDIATWRERFPRPGEFGSNPVLDISPDGRYLVAADWMEYNVTLWDATTGRTVREFPLKGEDRYVRTVKISSDGKSLVAGQMKGFLQWWDVETGKELRTLQLDDPDQKINREMYCYAFHLSPDGKHIATTDRTFGNQGEQTRVAQWDAVTGKMLQNRVLPGGTGRCAWSDDGAEIIAPLAAELKRMNLTNGQTIWQTGEATDRRLAASSDGRILATAFRSSDKTGLIVRIWEAATGTEITRLALGRADHFALMADNRHLVTTDVESLRVWDLATRRERVRQALPDPSLSNWGTTVVTALVLSPDGRRAFTSMSNGTALVWDLTPASRAEPLAKNPNLDGWYTDLAGPDAGKAYAALWRLAEAPAEAVVSLIQNNLNKKPIPEPDAERVAKWIEQLSDPKFVVRDAANRELEALGPLAYPALRKALEGNPSAELRRRASDLLAKPKRPISPGALAGVRAIELLERFGTSGARRLLQQLASGAPEHELTCAAKGALVRMSR